MSSVTANPASQLQDLNTRQQIAAYTGVSVHTLARWAVEKKGPRITKLGSAVRYRREDVLAWIAESAA